MFLHIYDLLTISHLEVIFVYSTMRFLLQFTNINIWQTYLFFQIDDNLCTPHLVDIFIFPYLCQ